MTSVESLAAPSLSLLPRDLPLLDTEATIPTTSTEGATTTATTEEPNANTATTELPGVTTTSASMTGLPVLSTDTTSLGYTTPSIGVPGNKGNPYISRTSQPLGTVFIAVGSVVGVILLVFVLFHLIKSLTASSLAKKTVNNEKFAYQRFAQNNNLAYGGSSGALNSTFLNNTEYKGSVSKMPLVGSHQFLSSLGPMGGEYSSSALMDTDKATSRQDLTNMFISPTMEMTNNRLSSHTFNNSVTNLSIYGRSNPDLTHTPVSNKQTSSVPNYYMNDNFNNSQYDLSPQISNLHTPGERKPRNPIPSMYLEDLIDD